MIRRDSRSLAFPRKSNSLLMMVAAFMVASVFAGSVSVRANQPVEEARQLIRLTTDDNILRIDAEQAGFLMDQLPEEFPAELRSQVRQTVDINLDYNKTQLELGSRLSSRLDNRRLDSQSRWWGSTAGRSIARAESSMYAAVAGDSSFDVYHASGPAIDPPDAALVEEVVKTSEFNQFLGELVRSTFTLRLCLIPNSAGDEQASECANFKKKLGSHSAELTQRIASLTAEKYSTVSSGDLRAYLTFLSSADDLVTLKTLREEVLQVQKDSWQRATQGVETVMSAYYKSRYGRVDDAALGALIAKIDNASDLPQARFDLRMLSINAPPDARVLVQLARVTLKLATNLTQNDVAPSVPRIDDSSLKAAQQYIESALALDRTPDALMIAGHIAYLHWQFQKSVDLLGEAKMAGGTSPWLHINLGDALWAIAMDPGHMQRPLIPKVAAEFEEGLKSTLPPGAEERAVHQLGPVYAELGSLSKADSYYRRYVSMQSGRNRAYALQRYTHFLLLYAKDTDKALSAAREMTATYNFPAGKDLLLQTLLIRAGTLVSAGHSNKATPLLKEASEIQPDLATSAPDLARLPGLFPGVIGIHAAGVTKDFTGRMGGQVLVLASIYATPQQIEQLLAWGADPNYLDPDEGTPLHVAILANNEDAVRTLLAHGANPSTPFIDGRNPAALENGPSDTRRGEILALVRSAQAASGGSAVVGGPFKVGYEYILKKDMDGMIDGKSWSSAPHMAGEHLVYRGECQFTDSSIACFIFDGNAKTGRLNDIAIRKGDLVSWAEWFSEVGPAR